MARNSDKLFEIAIRSKWRFPYKGLISLEDLWDLPIEELDTVFKALNAEAKVVGEESLLKTKSTEDAILESKIHIVKYIAAVKEAEADARREDADRKARKQNILSIIARKQEEELQNMSVEDLTKMLEDLD